jgi:hypothetical protein
LSKKGFSNPSLSVVTNSSAPRERQSSFFEGEWEKTTTRAPSALANWMAKSSEEEEISQRRYDTIRYDTIRDGTPSYDPDRLVDCHEILAYNTNVA